MRISDLYRVSEYEWKITRDFQLGMRVPVIIFADAAMIYESMKDTSLQQAINATFLPGVVKNVCVMPDVHQGYGFPIGGVAATALNNGVISPGAIGYDINCGVRLMGSQIEYIEAKPFIEDLINKINSLCPSGVGKGGRLKLTKREIEEVCTEGARWALRNGFATNEDIEFIEDKGCIGGADPSKISPRAVQRGLPQLGSLGSGNHFIEIDVVDAIENKEAAAILGLREGCLSLQIHTGSRGLGHQVCSDYVKGFQRTMKKYHFNLPDRELVCVPLDSREGRNYLSAMRCAANFAFANRQLLAFNARRAFKDIFSKSPENSKLMTIYDLAHNIGKIENHIINGKEQKVCVHRKGATRAYGPGHKDLPNKYKEIGQPVLIPGSMGSHSWVMLGTRQAEQKSFSSCSHGAGRVMSRTQARRRFRGEKVRELLFEKGIFIKARSMAGLSEEAPQVYKNIDRVIRCVEGANLANRVARLKPVAVIKG
ncbi:MAG: RtcB family protein [Anaerolineaceae bacterium]|nr:RtcB family protein [Anaerolineaceae bacterium]